MKLELNKAPFDSHNNLLFDFIKKDLIDSNIYDTSKDAFPYTDKSQKYQFKLSECYSDVLITVNGIDYIKFAGSNSVNIFYFYFQPVLGVNDIKVLSLDKTQLYCDFLFKCYNIHSFLAFTALQFKNIWNNLYQTIANKYYDLNKITDLDNNYVVPSPKKTSLIGALLGTARYSLLSDAEYSTFLHGVFEAHSQGGSLKGIYELQNIFPTYFDRIDIIPWEYHYGNTEEIAKKLIVNSNTNIEINPNYLFLGVKNIWGLLPRKLVDTTGLDLTSSVWDVYVDGENEDGQLKVKLNSSPYFYKQEEVVEETVDLNAVEEDTDGEITGFEKESYTFLQNPSVDGTIYEAISTGDVDISQTVTFLEDKNLNIIRLGTKTPTKLTSLKVKYKSYNIPYILGRFTLKGGIVNNLLKNQLDVYSGLGDDKNLSYLDNNYGSVVIVIRVLKKIDDELKGILRSLIRNLLPIHLNYVLIFQTKNVWDYWGQTNRTFGMFDSTGVFSDITFGDLM